ALYDGSRAGSNQEIGRYIETQIQSILSDRVLDAALADRAIANLSFVRNSPAPRLDLKQQLRVVNLPNTYIIQVSLDSSNPSEAAAIVNSVVSAYMDMLRNYLRGTDSLLKKRMETWLENQENEKKAKEDELDQLVKGGRVDPQALDSNDQRPPANAQDPDEAVKSLTTKDVSIEQYRRYLDQLVQVNLELVPFESLLQQRQAAFEAQGDQLAMEADVPPGLTNEQLQTRIEMEFRQIPAVAQVLQDLEATDAELTHSSGVARKGNDPATRAAQRRRSQLEARHDALWREHYGEIRDLVLSAASAAPPVGDAATIEALSMAELQAKVDMLRRQRSAIVELLQSMEVKTQQSNNDTFRANRLNAEIQILSNRIEPVHKKLEDLKFQTDKETVRVELTGPASVPKTTSSNKRNRFIAVALLATLGGLMGLFALLEVKAERVGDPDMLSTRIQSEVYSLPPLPSLRSRRKLGAPGDDDQIERFIQRLDHLRFAVCGDHPEVGLGRCVLITSAIGGEGKTTLAAQLAARCGHAGHSTLLIDGDLRRGTLCPLLDIPDGPGLSDVLKEEASVEDVAVPVQGGAFHLLRAGTPIHDTSRIFQGRGFGMLIARLRQLYDLIIIDSPPVLPVPDALIIGRWTDGAVLASRYDVSRAPQVERARRQLNNAGVPVLGTVINGMKSSDAYYGRYTYSRTRSVPTDAETEDETDSSSTS
ncbi:MAG: polysaccharide biosynthesis tyrosine autokinase, partial [Actinomycetota bacterium]|nr:polysaccharide biosynthesis tyrosine autokinase [Actinomycetota bacterium]